MPPVSPVLFWMFRLQNQVGLSAHLLGYCSLSGKTDGSHESAQSHEECGQGRPGVPEEHEEGGVNMVSGVVIV